MSFSTEWIWSGDSLNVTATASKRIVDDGKPMTLSCNTSHNWKTCAWLYDGIMCKFEYAFNDSNKGNEWTYEKTLCDSKFAEHDFLKPDTYNLGNNNTLCRIQFKSVPYEGEYFCKFQRCNPEENDYCKTKVSTNNPLFTASISVEVNLIKPFI